MPPPRYPHNNNYGKGPQYEFHANSNTLVVSPKNGGAGGIPRGGTGATDDSFLSNNLKQQAQPYSVNYVNPAYSQMGLSANSFHQVGDTSTNSFDIVGGANGGPTSFSNTATDWGAAQRA